MTTYYGDTSALVKRYVNETGSEWLRNMPRDRLHILARCGVASWGLSKAGCPNVFWLTTP